MRKKFFFIAVSAIVAVSAGIFAYLNTGEWWKNLL